MSRTLCLALFGLPLAGCMAEEPHKANDETRVGELLPTPADPLPHLILYRSADDGGPAEYMQELISGLLDLQGPCVAIVAQDVAHAVVTPEGVVGSDVEGAFLTVGPHQMRHGEAVLGPGGFMGEAFPRADMLQSTVPEGCGGMPLVEMAEIFPLPPTVAPAPQPAPPIATTS